MPGVAAHLVSYSAAGLSQDFRRSGRRRQVLPGTPLGPSTIVERLGGAPDFVQRKRQHRGGDARAAGRDDRAARIDAGFFQRGADRVGVFQAAVLNKFAERDVEAAGDMARAHACARLGRFAAKTVCGTESTT